MRIVLIAAMGRNRVIGRDGGLPWRLPDDLAAFKRTTFGHPVVMGHATFRANGRPLPGRTNIALSRRADLRLEGAIVVPDLDQALATARAVEGHETVFIIGGGEIYRLALPRADELDLTEVDAAPEGDVTFPEFDEAEWREIERSSHQADARHAHAFVRRRLVRAGS
ncbi:MAG: dihydrofolate reductase [Phycisphaerales bacterium]|nr:dihydrofolate reductase [Phycisphaerales bacterium]